MASPAMVLDRLRGALWGIFIADSLSMPVHWYYNPGDIRRDFGVIETYQMLPPVILAKLDGPAAAKERMMRHLTTTHESRKLAGYAEQYSDLIYSLVSGADLRTATQALATRMRVDLAQLVPYDDIRIVHSTFGSACYIEDSFPSLLYLAYKYADSFEKAVLANTNVGGENCHRGAALGAVMGAAAGESRIPRRLIDGLHDSKAIKAEIDAYVTALHPELLQQCGQQAAAAAAAGAATSAPGVAPWGSGGCKPDLLTESME
eukprot:XP_001689917.1 predicted protein [Chlamydomonas reinhardtii]